MFVRFSGFCVCTLLVLMLGACSGSADDATPTSDRAELKTALEPVDNLLLICIDTARADTFSELGDLTRDRLNQWDDSALVFTQAQSAAPWTVPSLGSVFTGLLPDQHGAGYLPGLKNVSMDNVLPGKMRKDIQTIAGQALAAGVSTSVLSASAWTFSAMFGGGIVNGFSQFEKFSAPGAPLDAVYWPQMLEAWKAQVSAQQDGERSVRFLHFMEAHNWHLVEEPELEKRVATFTPEQRAHYLATAPEPACRVESSTICNRYLVYANAVTVMRDAVAEILDTLQASGRLENTLVVVFSDHGESFHDRIHMGRKPGRAGNDPAFGHGGSLFQELLHVPLIVWHPGIAGRQVDEPVGLVDVARSVTHWMAIDFEAAGGTGHLLHQVSNGDDSGRVLYATGVSTGERQIAARQGPLKSIWYRASDRTHYFDLLADPGELHPIYSDQLVMRFDNHYVEYERMERSEVTEKATTNEKHLKQLQAIGYLQGLEYDEESEE